MRGILIGFGLVLLCVGVIAILASLPEDGAESGGAPVPRGDLDGEIRAVDGQYEPQRVTALPETTLSFINRDDEAHGIRFERGDLDTIDRVEPDGAETIEIGRQNGEFPFVCPIHPDMRGTLIVQSQD